jgi:hypothetical protein
MYQIHLTTILSSVIIFLSETNTQIIVADISGRTLKNFEVGNKGFGHVTVTARTLSAGNYIYSLIANGKNVDSKKMMITK